MNQVELINQIKDHAGEYLEMTQHPDSMMIDILAYKCIQLQSYITYLEKRLSHVSTISNT